MSQNLRGMLSSAAEHGAAPAMGEFLGQLFEAAGARLHAFVHRRNRELPAEASDSGPRRVEMSYIGG